MARNTLQNSNASLVFNGTSTKVAVTTGASLNDLTASSVSFWMLWSGAGGGGNGRIFHKGPGATGFFDITINDAGTLTMIADWSGNDQNETYQYNNKGIWNFATITYSGGLGEQFKLYINGSLVSTSIVSTSTGSRAADNTALAIGNRTTDTARAFNGILRNMNWYNRVLTSTEVASLYNGTTVTSGLIASYALGEGAGSIAYDTSGNGNNGTITSGTWTRDTPSKTRKTVNDNLVYNGDFEIAPVVNVAQTTAFKWYDGTVGGNGSNTASVNTNRTSGIYFWDKAGSGSILLDDTVKKSGSYSLKLSTTATGSYTTASLADFNRDDYIPVLPSTDYTYSLWRKTNYVSGDATSGAGLNFRQLTGARSLVSSSGVSPIKTTTDWTLYTGTVTTAATTRFIAILPYITASDGAATLIMDAWFDDITLTPTTATTRSAISAGPPRRLLNNLVYNGDFEYAPAFTAATNTASRFIDGTASSGTGNENPYKWRSNGASNNFTVQYDSTERMSGTYSMKVSLTSAAGAANVTWGNQNFVNTMIPCLPSTSYTISCYCKTNNVASAAATLGIVEYTGALTVPATPTTNTLTGTNGWTLLTKTWTTSATTSFLQPRLQLATGNVCDAWFDDVTLDLTTPTTRSAA